MSEEQSLSEKAASPVQSTAPSTPAATPPVSTAKKDFNWLIPLAVFALAAVLFFVISSCWTTWENAISIKTDDAYVRADVAPLSTKANGIVLKTMIKDYDQVVPGQVLVELRSEDYKDKVVQAQQTVAQVKIKLDDMKQRKEKQDAEVADAEALLENSRATAKQSDDVIAIAKAAVEEAQANLEVASATIKQSESSVKSATADSIKAEAQKRREEALLAEESSTKERVEQVIDDNDRAAANLDSQKSARLKAKAEYLGKKAQLLKAKQQLASSIIDKDKAFIAIKSREAEVVSRTKQRELLDGEERQLKADLASKQSGVDSSETDLGYTTIKAPVAGRVGELKVKPGQFVSAGTQVITLISSTPWVIANFRETQLAKITAGDKAEIEVDALPGRRWKGHVESIAPASGAQFSLLPPDNASGNFTKVIQRIPVKIIFDDEVAKLSELRPGMSVTTSITPNSGK
ncbi:MAG: HlyD family secretion protein [Candidatus Obscuribacterales bacterium]|nr:HlyD family secretion protein [Candidatus Obscuribacterales bacterium]